MRGLVWFATCLLTAASARAQDETVEVRLAACEAGAAAWDTQQMLAIVRVEIAPRQLVTSETGPTWLLIDACDPDRLLLRHQRGSEAVDHEMPLDDVPVELKPRVAALAVAELASGVAPAPPRDEPPAAPVPPAERPRARPRLVLENELPPELPRPKRTETWLGLGVEGRVFFTEPGPSFGPRLTLAMRYAQLGIVGLLGRQEVQAGEVTMGIVAAAVDIPLWRPKGAPGVSVAGGGELGVTWAKGTLRDDEAEQADSKQAPFAAALMRLNWGGRVAKTAYAQVAWALGYAQGMHALALRKLAATTHGPFAAMAVTIAWAP